MQEAKLKIGWGVFEVSIPVQGLYEVHVAPVDEQSALIYPHVLESNCLCEPQEEMTIDGDSIWVHNRMDN